MIAILFQIFYMYFSNLRRYLHSHFDGKKGKTDKKTVCRIENDYPAGKK